MQRFFVFGLIGVITGLLLPLSLPFFSRNHDSTNETNDIPPAEIDPRTHNRPPVNYVVYSPDGRYAADIAAFHLYIFDTQRNEYISVPALTIPQGFAFNADSSLIAVFGCKEQSGSHYCANNHIIVSSLYDGGSEALSAIDDVPLVLISRLRFVEIYGQEFIAAFGCKQLDESILGICYPRNMAEAYWRDEQWISLPNE